MSTIKSTPPERLTVEEWIEHKIPLIQVFYKGEPFDDCTAYSVPDKWVERYARDSKGDHIIVGEGNNQRLKIERLFGGEVRVEWKRGK